MSDAPDTIWIWAFSKDGELHRNEGSWPAQQTDEAAKQHAPIQYRRADLVDAEIERLQGVIETVLHESSGLAGLCETQLRRRLVRICKIAMRERESQEGLNNE